MDTYSLLRQIADSWGLLALFIFFIGVVVWAFWPGLSKERRDASEIPFRNETASGTDARKSGGDRTATHEESDDE